jgi:hypothetical protein
VGAPGGSCFAGRTFLEVAMSRLAQIERFDAIYNYNERFSGSMLA